MAKNILIAALGAHPAVVTGMVKALQEFEHLQIDTVCVLYPQDTGKDIAQLGFPLIQEYLEDKGVSVSQVPLPFADPNTYETSLAFLQELASLLARYPNPAKSHVYISLTGGRKNMAALLALVAQFFPQVKGLYHLLDRREGKRDAAFPSIQEIVLMSSVDQARALDPPLEALNLFSVPYPGPFAASSSLWQFLKDPNSMETVPVSLTPDAERFYLEIFRPASVEKLLDVWLSKTAYDEYQQLAAQGSQYAAHFMTCFEQMRSPRRLLGEIGMHGTFSEFHFYKRRRTPERPFYYTEPNPIHLYPKKPVERVIVCGLVIEHDGPYEPSDKEKSDCQPYKRLSELKEREKILLVPLGKSPMVATQCYTLLQGQQRTPHSSVSTVAVVYPEKSVPIKNGVRLLATQFKRKGVAFLKFPMRDLRDIDSTDACERYLSKLLSTITRLRQVHPDKEIVLSLSGGRKGMAALTLFAAQRAGLSHIYHTLITDIALEARIGEETSFAVLDKLHTDDDRGDRLFLERYDKDKFELFTIPVIPLGQGDTTA